MLRVIRCTNISLKAVTLKGSGTAENDVCLNPPVSFRLLFAYLFLTLITFGARTRLKPEQGSRLTMDN